MDMSNNPEGINSYADKEPNNPMEVLEKFDDGLKQKREGEKLLELMKKLDQVSEFGAKKSEKPSETTTQQQFDNDVKLSELSDTF